MPAPLRLRLDGAALVANWRALAARQPHAACGAAVKADGYGLGAREVVARLAAAGCRDFFVATWDEAAALGALPDWCALSVLHGVRVDDMAAALASPARPVLNSPAQVARWRETGRPCDVMVDTGMNRLGLTPDEACSGLLGELAIETLHSHLACADEPDHPLNEAQLARFRALRHAIPARRYSLANSAGVLLGADYGFDLTRPGLALYGGEPGPAARGLVAQVAHLEAEVLQVRTVLPGETIGYGGMFEATAIERIGILNIGYADGYFRAFGGGEPHDFGIGSGVARSGDGRSLPVVGRVSMDLIAVRLGDADVTEGDRIRVMHDLPLAARATGLSQYELLTGLGRRYERVWE